MPHQPAVRGHSTTQATMKRGPSVRTPESWADSCCAIRPARRLGPGEFDVSEPPVSSQAVVDGVRVIAALGTPICIHPWRVSPPPRRYASRGEPLPSVPGRRADDCLMRQPDSGEHPFRVGIPPGAYASAGEPVPAMQAEIVPAPPPEALILPESLDDLSGWMVEHLRSADRDEMFSVVARLEREAGQRFAPGEVVAVLRRVLSVELARS